MPSNGFEILGSEKMTQVSYKNCHPFRDGKVEKVFARYVKGFGIHLGCSIFLVFFGVGMVVIGKSAN